MVDNIQKAKTFCLMLFISRKNTLNKRVRDSSTMATLEYQSVLERTFRAAYVKRYHKPVSEFRDLKNGNYLINSIMFTETEVKAMLHTLEEEIAAKKRSLVNRLITFLGGGTA